MTSVYAAYRANVVVRQVFAVGFGHEETNIALKTALFRSLLFGIIGLISGSALGCFTFNHTVVISICHRHTLALNSIDKAGNHKHMRIAVNSLLGLKNQPPGKAALYAWHKIYNIVAVALVFIGIATRLETESTNQRCIAIFGKNRQRKAAVLVYGIEGIITLVQRYGQQRVLARNLETCVDYAATGRPSLNAPTIYRP